MELELDLGSGKYDDESGVWELDLGDNSPVADSPPDTDSELELVLPWEITNRFGTQLHGRPAGQETACTSARRAMRRHCGQRGCSNP